MRRFSCILILLFCFSCESEGSDRLLVTVKRNYAIPKTSEDVQIVIDWKELSQRIPSAQSGVKITDQNFGRGVSYKLVDVDNNKSADYAVLNYTFSSNEPIISFLIEPLKVSSVQIYSEKINADSR